MPYDEHLAERIRQAFRAQRVVAEEKKMMGGLCFMVDGKMCCGIHYSKKKKTDLLMARIGQAAQPAAMAKPGCQPMDFTGRPMKGFVFVTPEGFDMDDDLAYWVGMCLAFNPMAKKSR